MITINGFFGGTKWNVAKREMEVLTFGTRDNGSIICGLNVSGKDQDGNRVYGKSVDVKILVKSADEAMRVKGAIASKDTGMYSCDGFFVPNNYTSGDKEVKGNQFLVTDSTTFQPFDNQAQAKPRADSVPVIENDEDEIPF